MGGDSVGFMNVLGAEALYSAVFAHTPLDEMYYRLNTSSISMTQTDAGSVSYTEPADSGYIPYSTVGSIDLGHNDSYAFASQIPQWTFNGSAGSETIYGMWLSMEDDSSNVLYGWNLPSPIVIPADTVTAVELGASMQLGTCSTVPVPPPPPPPPPAGYIADWDAASLSYSDGAPVDLLPDTTTSYPMTQPDVDAQPVYLTGAQNGLGAVSFAGTAQYLECVLGPTVSDYSLYCVIQQASGNDGGILGNVGSGTVQIRAGQGGDFSSTFDGINNPSSDEWPIGQGAWMLLEYLRSGTTVSWYQNGVALGSGTMDPSQLLSEIGGFGGTSNLLDGSVGQILLYPTAHDSADREATEDFLTAKWGI
jgi:hypothetical protein